MVTMKQKRMIQGKRKRARKIKRSATRNVTAHQTSLAAIQQTAVIPAVNHQLNPLTRQAVQVIIFLILIKLFQPKYQYLVNE